MIRATGFEIAVDECDHPIGTHAQCFPGQRKLCLWIRADSVRGDPVMQDGDLVAKFPRESIGLKPGRADHGTGRGELRVVVDDRHADALAVPPGDARVEFAVDTEMGLISQMGRLAIKRQPPLGPDIARRRVSRRSQGRTVRAALAGKP